jgi:hypothetical protein
MEVTVVLVLLGTAALALVANRRAAESDPVVVPVPVRTDDERVARRR